MTHLRNSVRLMGNLGQNPDVKDLNGGRKLSRFSLATSESYKDDEGNKVTDTQWHNIVAWGKTAEIVEKYLKKGSQVALEGRLINRTYNDKEGTKKYISEVVVNDLVMLDKKKTMAEAE